MKTAILTKEQFENQSFTHWLRKGIMYNNYPHYLKFAISEYEVKSDEAESETEPEEESGSKPEKLYIWCTVGDDRVRDEHAGYDGMVFDWNDNSNPGGDFGCRCHAEFIENNPDNPLKVGDKITPENEHLIKKTGDKGSVKWDDNKNKFERIERAKTKISNYYGDRIHPITGVKDYHEGTDFAVPVGTPIPSPVDGKIESDDYSEGNGNRVSVVDKNGIQHHFYHMRERTPLKKGREVKKGNIIGYSGNTGRSSGSHVHYESRDSHLGGYPKNVIPPEQENLDYLDNYWL